MVTISIYTGETFRNATSNIVATDMPHIHHVLFDFLAIWSIGTAIRATTTGRIPLKMRVTTGWS